MDKDILSNKWVWVVVALMLVLLVLAIFGIVEWWMVLLPLLIVAAVLALLFEVIGVWFLCQKLFGEDKIPNAMLYLAAPVILLLVFVVLGALGAIQWWGVALAVGILLAIMVLLAEIMGAWVACRDVFGKEQSKRPQKYQGKASEKPNPKAK